MAAQFGDEYYSAATEEDEAFLTKMKKNGKYEDDYDMENYGDEGYEEDYNYEYDDAGVMPSAESAVADTKQDILDSLYNLDYEDIVAGIPCRFKYQPCKADDFGLTAEDIILADDKELNGFVGLKKISPYYQFNTDDQKVKRKLSKKRKALRVAIRERARELEEQHAKKEHQEAPKPVVVKATEDGETGKRRRRRKKNKGNDTSADVTNVAFVTPVVPDPVEVIDEVQASCEQVKAPIKKRKKVAAPNVVSEKKKRLDLYK